MPDLLLMKMEYLQRNLYLNTVSEKIYPLFEDPYFKENKRNTNRITLLLKDMRVSHDL